MVVKLLGERSEVFFVGDGRVRGTPQLYSPSSLSLGSQHRTE
jgi:hypothetical protein